MMTRPAAMTQKVKTHSFQAKLLHCSVELVLLEHFY